MASTNKSTEATRNRRERTVTTEQVATVQESRSEELPERVQQALDELAGATKEGLLALKWGRAGRAA